jgi:hypothetical protein
MQTTIMITYVLGKHCLYNGYIFLCDSQGFQYQIDKNDLLLHNK